MERPNNDQSEKSKEQEELDHVEFFENFGPMCKRCANLYGQLNNVPQQDFAGVAKDAANLADTIADLAAREIIKTEGNDKQIIKYIDKHLPKNIYALARIWKRIALKVSSHISPPPIQEQTSGSIFEAIRSLDDE